jgi:hypothetical protein
MKIMTKEEAIQILSTRDAHGVLCGYTSGVTEALDMAVEALRDKLTGEWIDSRDTDTPWNDGFKCSACNGNSLIRYNFCPHCGARMLRKDGEA